MGRCVGDPAVESGAVTWLYVATVSALGILRWNIAFGRRFLRAWDICDWHIELGIAAQVYVSMRDGRGGRKVTGDEKNTQLPDPPGLCPE